MENEPARPAIDHIQHGRNWEGSQHGRSFDILLGCCVEGEIGKFGVSGLYPASGRPFGL